MLRPEIKHAVVVYVGDRKWSLHFSARSLAEDKFKHIVQNGFEFEDRDSGSKIYIPMHKIDMVEIQVIK